MSALVTLLASPFDGLQLDSEKAELTRHAFVTVIVINRAINTANYWPGMHTTALTEGKTILFS